MKKILFAVILLSALALSACFNPPTDTIIKEIDGKTTVVWDRDQDGQPDIDPEGNIEIVGDYQIADTIDTALPTILQALGGIIGVPLLVVAGRLWGRYKPGRILANTVMSMQAAREALTEANLDKALDVVDDALGDNQVRETTEAIRDIKDQFTS